MDPVIVVWCFHTKLAVSWYSAPVILSINHFTYKFKNGEIIADAINLKKIQVVKVYCEHFYVGAAGMYIILSATFMMKIISNSLALGFLDHDVSHSDF